MSSTEEVNSEMRSEVRLSTLNPQVREKLVKFDTANDGELSIEEAIQGLVTLQKQSNNYKRMLYLIVPLMMIMLACVLGVNILAIQLTKDLEASTTSGNPVLTNKAGNVLATSSYTSNVGMLDWLMNYNYSPIDNIEIDGLSMIVNSIYLEDQNNITRLYVDTQMLYFYIGSDGTYDLDFNQGYNNNAFAIKAFDVVNKDLKTIQENIILIKSQSEVLKTMEIKTQNNKSKMNIETKRHPETRAGPGFGCKLVSTNCS